MFLVTRKEALFYITCQYFTSCAKTIDMLNFAIYSYNKEVRDLLEKLSEKITNFLVESDEISQSNDEFNCYKYGVEIALSSMLNIALILTIGILTKHFAESIIFLLVFIPTRQFTGGYHADTYFKCNLFLCISFILVLILFETLNNYSSLYVILLMNLISLSVILIFSPVENKNKPIKKEKRAGLKLKSTLIALFISVISITLHCYLIQYGTLLSCTLLMISMLIILGRI